MLNILKPLSLYSWYIFFKDGLFALQGPHQLAQKSINKYCPLKSLKFIILPEVSFTIKSGAILPKGIFEYFLSFR